MLNDWKRQAMEYRDVDREAQRKAEEVMSSERKNDSANLASTLSGRSAEHTPGPWAVESPKPARYPAYRIVGRTERYVAEIAIMAHNPASADARLIAAAPELLAALELLHDNLAEYQRINHIGGYDNHDMKMARAAIARVRS